ncbi:ATP-binding SpoIIE family protein phosphatase [Kineococcus aurantiacus]|uniref:Serine phosphatase RsbU (Regulator of sigma subunit)/PAS domain-containing protein n=1 Tax=Kineococcus aurantiacus TaxID=37633 RepID=A0A7Y9DMA7_9ACTN|nr:SpoIIE family protein phosphatase [Kineococcus aurantiacus]NYD23245.1 serine phosphatase RsbU (regulator of sigma subunit)/PAS domain-containing protein [Kineococcus aurantiacus]
MPGSRPQALALRVPAAVLLLESVPGRATGALLALDDAGRACAGLGPGDPLPADLAAYRERAGLPGGPVWERLAQGLAVAGQLLGGHLWVMAGRVPDRDQLVVVLAEADLPDPSDPSAGPGPAPGSVVAAAPGTALSAVRDGGVVVEWADGGYARTTGTPAPEVVGRSSAHLLRARDEQALDELAAAVATGRPTTVVVLDHRADGTDFLHQVRAVPLRDRTGAVGHVLTRHTDVTRRTAADRGAGARLATLTRLDAVLDTGGEDPAATLQAVAAALGDQLVAAALVAEVRTRPGTQAVEAEVVAAHGRDLHPRLGRRFRRPRGTDPTAGPVPDPVLQAGAGHLVDLGTADAPVGTVTAWLGELSGAGTGTGALAVALRGREDVLGVLVVRPHPGGLGPEDRSVVAGAARRTGLLVENARLHEREHALAETLQRSMLPDSTGLEGIDGLDVWTFYASNADHAQVGGDWYDVLPATGEGPGGTAGGSVAGVVVGDVVGHDLEAAAAMGQIRSVVRTAAHEFDDPGSVLMRVDQLASGMRIGRMASLVFATLQRLDDGEWEMAWSSAGHLPPLLRRGTDVEVLSEATGTLVGLGERPRPTRERALSPGDVLVLYTDGLIETRARPMRDGLEVLVEVLSRSRARDAAGIGEELLAGLGDTPEDDTAIVVVRVPEESELGGEPLRTADTPRRRRWQLPSEPSSIGKARHATLRACAVWGLDRGPVAEIVVSELVANAVLHGWGTIGLRLFDLPGTLRIEVEDDSPEEPRVVEARPDGAGGHGMRLVASLGRWGTTRTRRGKIVWVEISH